MNFASNWRQEPSLTLLNELLVDVAVKIQLAPYQHDKAVGHYQAIHTYLDREESPLRNQVLELYPQGSMAMGSTIRSRDEEDLFDIDIVAELAPIGASPGDTLDTLFEALNGPVGSRYHGMVDRQTRCVTVRYTDMHLDVTPLYRRDGWPDRAGMIAHAKAEESTSQHKFVPANPWGGVDWFKATVPPDDWFQNMYLQKSYAYDAILVERADAQPVPEHRDIYAKPLAVVALQLTKRWARLNWEKAGAKGRCVPSVLLSYYFASNAGKSGSSLVDEIIYQAECIKAELTHATADQRLIDVRNPRFDEDHISDRWPGNLTTQWAFAQALERFSTDLQRAKTTDDVEERAAILGHLFGESVAASVVKSFYERAGADVRGGRSLVNRATATALAGLETVQAKPSLAISPPHKFFGDQ